MFVKMFCSVYTCVWNYKYKNREVYRKTDGKLSPSFWLLRYRFLKACNNDGHVVALGIDSIIYTYWF